MRRTRRLTLSILTPLALVLAACGGAEDSSSDGTATAGTGGGDTTLSLVAYSTP